MKHYLLSIYCVLLCTMSWGQATDVGFSLGLGTGIDWIVNRDLLASPLRYSGFALPLGLHGFEYSGKFSQQFELNIIAPQLTNNYRLSTPFDTQLTEWYKLNLNYQLLYRFKNDQAIGGALRSDFFLRSYDFLDGVSWESTTSLDLVYSYRIALNEKSFLLPQVALPIFGFIHRKSALTFEEAFLDAIFDGDRAEVLNYGRWKTLSADWWQFQLDLLYYWQLSTHFNLQIKAGINYYQIRFPEKVNHLNFPLRCAINYQF